MQKLPRGPGAAARCCDVSSWPRLERIERDEIDPRFVITHRMRLDEALQNHLTAPVRLW